MVRIVMWLGCVLAAGPAFAQESVRWLAEPQQAVAEAQRSLRPLMVYVLASNKDRDPKLDHEQKRALADPQVIRLSNRFVPLRLSRSMHQDVLSSFGLSERANMEMSFVTPDGQVLGNLSAGGVAQASSLANKLILVFQSYVKKLYDSSVKPVLENPESPPNDLRQAVQMAAAFHMTMADAALIELAEQPRLDATVRTAIYDTLASLSTKTAVQKLLAWARDGDARAANALGKCTPAGAEHLLDELSPEAEEVDYAVYKTVVGICNIRNIKPERFFVRGQPRLKQEEIERVTRLVRDAAQRWRESRDELD